MLVLFSLTFICWGASAADVLLNDEVHLERPLWSQYDPHLIAELVFAVANLLAIVRLLFFFQITEAIGPLQVIADRHTCPGDTPVHMCILLGFRSAVAVG